MRIGCLQFAPQVGDVNNNVNRADSILSKADPESLDLLVLPELAFSGYNFKSLQEISPFFEPSSSGISASWARKNALQYNCAVVVGYPETADVSRKWPTNPEYYNAAVMVSRDGDIVCNYRKTHLYYTDETWASEGSGYFAGDIPYLGRTAMGICMDINPYKFRAPWTAYEFANHILESQANLVIVPTAWLNAEAGVEPPSGPPDEPKMETIEYWISRLNPLIRAENEEEIIIIFANRTGIERDVSYAGTSAVIGIKKGEVNVYGILGGGSEELLVVDTNAEPFGQLVFRPDGTGVTVSGAGGSEATRPAAPESVSDVESVSDMASSERTIPSSQSVPSQSFSSRPSSQSGSATRYVPSEQSKYAPIQTAGQLQGAPSNTMSAGVPFTPSRQFAPPHHFPPSQQFVPPPQYVPMQRPVQFPGAPPNMAARRPNLPPTRLNTLPSLSLMTNMNAAAGDSDVLDTPTCPSPTPIATRPSKGFFDAGYMTHRYLESQAPAPRQPSKLAAEPLMEEPTSDVGTPLDSITPISDLSSAVSDRPSGLFWVPGSAKSAGPKTAPGWVTRQPEEDDDDESASMVSFQTGSSVVSGYNGDSRHYEPDYMPVSNFQMQEEPPASSWRSNNLRVAATPYRINEASEVKDGPTPRALDFNKIRVASTPPKRSESPLTRRPTAVGLAQKLELLVQKSEEAEMDALARQAQEPRGRQGSTKSWTTNEEQPRHTSLSRNPVVRSREPSSAGGSYHRSSSAIDLVMRAPKHVADIGDAGRTSVGKARGRSNSSMAWDSRGPYANTDLENIRGLAAGTSALTLSHVNHERTPSRDSSRGRQRVANWLAMEQVHLQTSSTTQSSRSQSAASGRVNLSREVEQPRYADDVRPATHQVHGSRSSSRAERQSSTRKGRSRAQSSSISRGRSPTQGDIYGDLSYSTLKQQSRGTTTEGRRKDTSRQLKTAAPDFSASVDTLVTSSESHRGRPPTPPLTNGPLTPKAMVLEFEDGGYEAALAASAREAKRAKEKQPRYRDNDAGSEISRPRSAMM